MDTNGRKLFPGPKVVIGTEEYQVPPLNFELLEKHEKTINEINALENSGNPAALAKKALPIIGDGLRRNYPELTDEALGKIIDMGNFRYIFEALMGVSGLTREILARQAGRVLPGENKPVAS